MGHENKEQNEKKKKEKKEKIIKENTEIINIFLDKYVGVINPQIKNKVELFKKLIFKNKDLFFEFWNEINLKTVYHTYLVLILSFIRNKVGKCNPLIFILFTNDYKRAFYNAINCFSNKIGKDMLNHFFLVDSDFDNPNEYELYKENITFFLNHELSQIYYYEKLKKFLSKCIPKLKYNEYSLVFDYLKKRINNYELTISEIYSYNKITKRYNIYIGSFINLVISRISKEQNKDIYNSQINITLSLNYKKSFLNFLYIEPDEYYEENASHFIKVIQQLAIDTNEKTKNIDNKDIILYLKSQYKDTFIFNLYKFILVLRKEKNNLFNILKNNNFFINNAFYVLYTNYLACFNDIKNNSKNKEENNKILEVLFTEIKIFLQCYISEKKIKKDDIFNIGDILLNLKGNSDILYIKKYLKKKFRIIYGVLMYNWELNNFS